MQRIAVVFIFFSLVIAVNFLVAELGIGTYRALGGVFLEDMGEVAFNNSPYFYLDAGISLSYSVLRTIFWILLYHLFRRRLPQGKMLLNTRMWGTVSILCLAPFTGILTLVLFTPENVFFAYPALFTCMITIIGILLLTGYIAETVKTETENKNLRLQKAYYSELEDNQRETAKLRHDMGNHLSVIAAFLSNNETDKANAYYQSLSEEFQGKHRLFCKNSIVNAVINAKYNQAETSQIDCFFNIDLNNLLSIDDISLCSIFANTLDNAIQACEQIADPSKRTISLQARSTDGYFSYEITNSKENEVIEKNGVFFTSKIDKKKHGYGISNVQDIVEHYHGFLDISHSESTFTLTILLKV